MHSPQTKNLRAMKMGYINLDFKIDLQAMNRLQNCMNYFTWTIYPKKPP